MASKARKVRLEVARADAGRRLDQYLAAFIPDLSRRKARVLLDIGGVFVDRARVKVASRKVRAGQIIEAHLGGALARAKGEVGSKARAYDAAKLPDYRLIHQDDDILVVDKPAGLLSAPTPESDRNNLLDMLARRFDTVYLVHRIDLFTSGILVFATSERANRVLGERFRTHAIEREYSVVVAGRVSADQVVDLPIDGRHARTHLAVAEELAVEATLMRARLETGRTHQIRIHCRHLGHPVLGDHQYGHRSDYDPPRMALHAARLGFTHPGSGEDVEFSSPWPEDLAAWLEAIRQTDGDDS